MEIMWYGSIPYVLVYNERELIQIRSVFNTSLYEYRFSLTRFDTNVEWVLVEGNIGGKPSNFDVGK